MDFYPELMNDLEIKRTFFKVLSPYLYTTADISFTARLSDPDLMVNAGQKIVYDFIINNAGKGYDNATGIFTTPINGTYQFIWTGMSQHTGPHFNWLTVNGVRVGIEYGDDTHILGKILF